MKAQDLTNLLNRAIAAIEDPVGTAFDHTPLIEDLASAVKDLDPDAVPAAGEATTTTTDLNSLQTLEDFRGFFEAIPNEKWWTHTFTALADPSRHCARGHLGESQDPLYPITIDNQHVQRLAKLMDCTPSDISTVNDGLDLRYAGKTPKARILAMIDVAIVLRGEVKR